MWWAGVGINWHVGIERFASFGVYGALKKCQGVVDMLGRISERW